MASEIDQVDLENRPSVDLAEMMKSKAWRLQNLYFIKNSNGKRVRFKPNYVQSWFYNRLHHRNLVLKARKLGFSTFIDLFILDECLFNSNVEAGICADTAEHAKDLFANNVKFPYENMPPSILSAIPAETDAQTAMTWANGSSVKVGVSVRSATPQLLHISEFGKICRKYPQKAKEIVTGSLEAVEVGGDQKVFIESTAEGRGGYFFDLCKEAQDRIASKGVLTALDYEFFFFPWFLHPEHRIDPTGVPIPRKLAEYFAEVEYIMKVKLSREQKAWYIIKKKLLGTDIMSEHPSTPEEPFKVVLEGTYFSAEMMRARAAGRITSVPCIPTILVDTYWDFGYSDRNCIIFTQDVGREIHIVDYYENSHEGMGFYKDIMDARAKEQHYRYGMHFAPHDVMAHEKGTGKSLREQSADLGILFQPVQRTPDKRISINAARAILEICWIDEEACAGLIDHLDYYRKQWNDALGDWSSQPLHDEHSHGADAFQCLAEGHGYQPPSQSLEVERIVTPAPAEGWT